MIVMYSTLIGAAAGFLASTAYFGGLWWTVQRLSATRRAGWWLLFSFLARFLLFTGCTVFVFAIAPNPVAALLGLLAAFVMVREIAKKKIGTERRISLKVQR
ncbi:MAG: ATP synthase subunit I [Desulfobulbaceae bacterium]|nr:ATP synthase subunit I [Desulfobulbaceae bacterium]